MNKKFTYKESGVDIEAGDRFVSSIGKLAADTFRPEVIRSIGGFGGLFKPDFSNFKKPVLVSSVDGVGTKLIVAIKAGIYDTVGQDLVNHCVNDIAVCGAEPLFFLDYFSTGKLDEGIAYDVVKGFSIACRENGCALIGGETAEMPDMYKDGDFDLAGTIVGVVDEDNIIDGSTIQKGDILLGVTGNGLHTNGYSLARKILFSKYDVNDYVPDIGMTIAESLLLVHPSYLALIRYFKKKKGVKGFAHITGGGIAGNTKRILPENCNLDVDWKSWEWPPLFKLIQKEGNVPDDDMRKTFNLGIGLTLVVSPEIKKDILNDSLSFFKSESQKNAFQILEIGCVD